MSAVDAMPLFCLCKPQARGWGVWFISGYWDLKWIEVQVMGKKGWGKKNDNNSGLDEVNRCLIPSSVEFEFFKN